MNEKNDYKFVANVYYFVKFEILLVRNIFFISVSKGSFLVLLLHELLVSLTGFPPEWDRSKVTCGYKCSNARAVQGRVGKHTNFVGNSTEDGRGDGLSHGDAEEVKGNDVTLLGSWGGVLDHGDSRPE